MLGWSMVPTFASALLYIGDACTASPLHRHCQANLFHPWVGLHDWIPNITLGWPVWHKRYSPSLKPAAAILVGDWSQSDRPTFEPSAHAGQWVASHVSTDASYH